MFPRPSQILRNQQGEGGSPPSPPPSITPAAGGESPAPPTYLTAQEFNRAYSEREKRTLVSIEKALDDRFARFAASRTEPDHTGPRGAPDAVGTIPDPRITALEKKLAEAEAHRQKDASERARSEERSALMNALNSQGITGSRATALAAWMHGEANMVRRSKDGRVVFALPRDGYEDELDVGAGLKDWLATDVGKEFAPPRPAQGSGETPPRPGGPRPPNGSKPARGDALVAALMGQTSAVPLR